MDVRLHDVIDIGDVQPVVQLRAIFAELKGRLSLRQRIARWDFVRSREVGHVVVVGSHGHAHKAQQSDEREDQNTQPFHVILL